MLFRTIRILKLLALVLCVIPVAPAEAVTITVTTQTDGAGCDAQGCTLRGAVAQANRLPGADEIILPPGTYVSSIQAALTVFDDLTISGAGARTTIIDANGTQTGSRAFDVTGGSLTLSHVTVRNGVANASTGFYGGNLRNLGATVRLDRVRFTGGTADSAGAVANEGGTMVIDHSLFDNNTSPFSPGAGGDGGAILNIGGTEGTPGLLEIRNTTITGNTARLAGGLIDRDNSLNRTTLIGVTIAGNTATDRGTGGVVREDDGGELRVRGSVIAGNVQAAGGAIAPWNCTGALIDELGNLESGTDCGFAAPGSRQNADPLLAALGDRGGETDVLALSPGSPALDLQSAAGCSADDQRGVPRPQGGACDAGAFELEVPPPPDGDSDGVPDALDNCPASPNPDQRDSDRDGRGDACDPPAPPPDTDGDGVPDTADNCVAVPNADQADRDRDRIGNACEILPPGDVPVVAGTTTVVRHLSGEVFVKLPRARTARRLLADPGFVPLKGVASVPVGSVVDARKGRLALQSASNSRPAADRRRRTQQARLSAGIFRVRQERLKKRLSRRIPTDLQLVSGAGAERACQGSTRRRPRKAIVRSLALSGRGFYRALGGASVGTSQNGTWITTDRCDGTLTEVGRGQVRVRDPRRKRTVTVRAGRGFLVKKPQFLPLKGRPA